MTCRKASRSWTTLPSSTRHPKVLLTRIKGWVGNSVCANTVHLSSCADDADVEPITVSAGEDVMSAIFGSKAAGDGSQVARQTPSPLTTVIREEPESIKAWRKEHEAMLAEKDAKEEKMMEELREKAKKDLHDWSESPRIHTSALLIFIVLSFPILGTRSMRSNWRRLRKTIDPRRSPLLRKWTKSSRARSGTGSPSCASSTPSKVGTPRTLRE